MNLEEPRVIDESREMADFLMNLLKKEGVEAKPLEWKTIHDPEICGAFQVPTVSGSVVVFVYPGLY